MKITVTGEGHKGSVTTARIICAALAEYGIPVKLVGEVLDRTPLEKFYEKPIVSKTTRMLKAYQVTLEVQQLPRRAELK